MKLLLSNRAVRDYKRLSNTIQKTVAKQLVFLLKNLAHPSLRAKKYDEARDIWQARINRNVRFYFRIHADVYKIITIMKHPH